MIRKLVGMMSHRLLYCPMGSTHTLTHTPLPSQDDVMGCMIIRLGDEMDWVDAGLAANENRGAYMFQQVSVGVEHICCDTPARHCYSVMWIGGNLFILDSVPASQQPCCRGTWTTTGLLAGTYIAIFIAFISHGDGTAQLVDTSFPSN